MLTDIRNMNKDKIYIHTINKIYIFTISKEKDNQKAEKKNYKKNHGLTIKKTKMR